MDHRHYAIVLLASAACLAAGTAWAQPREVAPAETAAAPELEEVIVQARRVEESQQEVPIAVSTVSERRLESAVVSSVADIQRLVPALQVTQGPTGQLDFTIRGAFLGYGVDPSVIAYIDEVPIDSRTLTYDLFDLASVQQLKGPQGTLFGRNSTGGAVLFTSRRPNPTALGGYASLRLGNLDDRRFEGAINLPLHDTLALRLAGQIERRDGTQQSVTAPGRQYDDRDNGALRASLLWTPNDEIENYTQVTHYRVREHRGAQTAIALAGPCTGPTTPAASCLYQPPFNAFLGTDNLRAFVDQQLTLPRGQTVNNDPASDEVDRDSITNTFTADLGAVSFKNILYYGDTNLYLSKDYDGTPAHVLDAFQRDHTETLYTESQAFGRLLDGRLDWRVGLVYSRDDGTSFGYQSVFPFPVSLTTPRTTTSDTRFESTALFGQFTYDFSEWAPGLSVTAGYRYTWDDRKVSTQAFSGMPTSVCALQALPIPTTGPVAFPSTDLASCTRQLRAKYGDDNYNLTVDWKPTDRILVYATTRKGYKTGSFNTITVDPALAQYAPEVIKDVELGLKADWRLGSVPIRTNLALYWAKYDNIQTSLTVVDPVNGSVTAVTLNFDQVSGLSNKAKVKGYEIEVTALPASWLEISGFYSRVDATYERFFSAGPRIDLAGENVAGVFPETFGLTTQLNLPLSGPFAEANITGSYYWRAGPLTNAASNLSVPPSGSYSSFDARFALRDVLGTGADLAVFGKNLSNRRNCPTNTVVSGEITEMCSEPRTYGVELRYAFGGERR